MFSTERRNVRGDDRLYIGPHHSAYDFIKSLYKDKSNFDNETPIGIDGIKGTVLLAEDCVGDGATLPAPVSALPVRNNKVVW